MALVFSAPEFSLIEFSSDPFANKLEDSPPDEFAVSKDPEDSDDELADVIRSDVGAAH